MPVSTTITVVGLKKTINALKNIDPELQKQFKADATRIAQPAIPLHKTCIPKFRCLVCRAIGNKKRTTEKIKGFDVGRAKKGVQMKFDTRRNAIGVILVIQKDQAAAIFETAGRKNANTLSNNLSPVQPGRTRFIGPAVYRSRRKIENEMKEMIVDTISAVQKKI
jgi:hypothetical protein